MSQEKTTLEIIAPSAEEAVTKGLEQLGLTKIWWKLRSWIAARRDYWVLAGGSHASGLLLSLLKRC
jgi:L-arabinose isomerase